MYLFEVAHSLEGFDRYWHHRLEDQQGAKPSTFYDEVAVKVQEDWIESAGD